MSIAPYMEAQSGNLGQSIIQITDQRDIKEEICPTPCHSDNKMKTPYNRLHWNLHASPRDHQFEFGPQLRQSTQAQT